MDCEKKVKAVLYEVSLFLAENSHDYEARELHKKVVALMDNAEFEEGRELASKRYSVVDSLKTDTRG